MGLTADCIYKRGQKNSNKGQQKIAELKHREKRMERIEQSEKVLCGN